MVGHIIQETTTGTACMRLWCVAPKLPHACAECCTCELHRQDAYTARAVGNNHIVNYWPIEDAHVSGTGSTTGAACSQMWGMESKLPHPVAEGFKQQ